MRFSISAIITFFFSRLCKHEFYLLSYINHLKIDYGHQWPAMFGVWLLVVFGVVAAVDECEDNVGWLCRQETLCDKCIQVHECCSFCYDEVRK